MKRVLIDTNVIMDYLFMRAPFALDAKTIWDAQLQGKFEGFISAITPLNIFYAAQKFNGTKTAFQAVDGVLSVFNICLVDRHILN